MPNFHSANLLQTVVDILTCQDQDSLPCR